MNFEKLLGWKEGVNGVVALTADGYLIVEIYIVQLSKNQLLYELV